MKTTTYVAWVLGLVASSAFAATSRADGPLDAGTIDTPVDSGTPVAAPDQSVPTPTDQDSPTTDDPTPTPAEDAPTDVVLRSIAYAGTGCPAGTIRGDLPTDGKSFLLFYAAFAAEAGPGVPFAQSRKNCQINLDLGYPDGWQFAVESIDYSGHLGLEDGVHATTEAAYYFQGDAATARASHDFVGPEDRAYSETALFDRDGDDTGLIWSGCQATRSLNVNVQVRIDTATAQTRHGLIAFADAPDTSGSQLVLKWRRCE